jgi:hypothetical protein
MNTYSLKDLLDHQVKRLTVDVAQHFEIPDIKRYICDNSDMEFAMINNLQEE